MTVLFLIIAYCVHSSKTMNIKDIFFSKMVDIPAEKKYQKAQIGTRNVIKKVFGVLKRHFPVLSIGLINQPKSALTTIVAVAVLLNILLKQNDTMPRKDLQIVDDLFEELDALPIASWKCCKK
ncbi:uncharacterized protein LOC113557585 [Rhopalosiphum maidis]|uniref:uncharacterized protein LOC113557585 n=1 Tax=Rhopalosiphum maidis TaxID=43146 RepID=UPI000EFE9190|nr:uncharacterized protein LOC113557585 [Rhopalosiphum maidis]